MKYRVLGKTGLEVSELCLGTMTFGGSGETWTAIGALPQDKVNELVKQSVDVELSADDLIKLDEASKLVHEYPGWMISFQSSDRQ